MVIDRRPESLAPIPATAEGTPFDGDESLVHRIMSGFRHSTQASKDYGDTEWNVIADMKANVLRAFIDGDFDAAAGALRDPARSNLFYGFDDSFVQDNSKSSYLAMSALDILCRFAESVGAIRTDDPEYYGLRELVSYDGESVIRAIGETTGWHFSVPNPFPEEKGTLTSRGVISQRTPYALYQAWQIKHMVGHIAKPRVLEIGGGLGRTAFYARELGIQDYTIVDLPMSSIAQAYFIGRTLGESALSLDGEERLETHSSVIKLRPPEWFLNTTERFDLIVNIDSMTEMDRTIADAYWTRIKALAGRFWSMNHEVNKFRIADLIADRSPNVPIQRRCCWVRRGYVEESVTLRPAGW